MLPRHQRLSTEDHQKLGTPVTVKKGAYLRIFFYEHSSPQKVAVVISKKVAPTAVERHRLKRIIINALRPLLKKDGPLIVVRGLPHLSAATKEDIVTEVKKLMTE